MKRTGFTLIELLVVLGIVAALLAILFPVLASLRGRGRQSACVNNLRQLHLACSLYAQDDGGLLPPYTSRATIIPGTPPSNPGVCVEESGLLLASLAPYTRSTEVWRCPSDTSRPVAGQTSCGPPAFAPVPVPDLTSYTYMAHRRVNAPFRGDITPVPLDYNSVMFTAATFPLLEDSFSCASDPDYAQYNHGGRWNRVFLDGHAKSFGLDCTNAPMLTDTP